MMTTLIDPGRFCPSSDTEDELLLSPGKQETYMRINHSKRSASPPLDEYSPLSGSPHDNRKPKRAKRNLEPEDSERDRTKLADVLHQRSAPGHARSFSDSDVLVGKRSTRKRSATSTKKPVSNVITSSSTFSPVIPTEKGRAQSVPLFASFSDTPRIDLRNPPPSPKRSRSRSPSKERELKFRMMSTPFTQLSGILETSSATGMVGESGNTLKATKVVILPKIVEETQPTASINEIDPLTPLPPLPPTTQVTSLEVPSTPSAKSLDELIPMSPLTPLPESPFSARLSTDVEDRSPRNTGWGVSSIEVNASEQTTKPLPEIVASTSRSRLPRPSLVPPISDVKSSSTTVPFTLPANKSYAFNKNNPKPAKKEELTVPKQDAFTAIMAGQRMKQMAEKEQMKKVLYPGLKAGSSTSNRPLRPEKQKLTARDRMRGKQKEKPQRNLFIPEEEEEDSHSEVELTAPTEDQNRFVASSISPELYSSTQNVKASMSEDAVMTTRSEAKVKSKDTIMLEQKASDDGQMPLIGSIEVTVAVPSERVVEASLPQPSPAPLLLEEDASSTNAFTMLLPSESGTLRPKLGTSKLPRRKGRQLSSAPTVDRVTRSALLKQKEKADIHLQPASTASVTMGQAGGLPVPAKRTASGSIKGPVPTQEKQLIEETPLPPGSPMKLSSPPKSTKLTAGDTSTTEDGVRTTQTGPPLKTPAKSRIPVMPSPSPAKLARTISRFSSTTDISGMTRSSFMDENNQHIGTGSSLSTLSNALEKLRMPPPSRPNTSMGFNRDGLGGDDDDTFGIPTRSKDDETVGRVSLGLGRSDSGLKRAVTLGASSYKSLEVDADVSSSSKMSGGTKKPLVQKSLAIFMSGKPGTAKGSQPAAGATMRGGMRPGLTGRGPIIFGGGLRRTISKKTSLPSVMASPVKGGAVDDGATGDIMQDAIQDADQDAQPSGSETVAAPTNDNDVLVLDDLEMQSLSKGKEKEKASTFGLNAPRRVSMVSVSHSLSQSLNSLPSTHPKNRGLMGPPETPPVSGRTGIRSSSSTYPSTSGSPSQQGTSFGTRSSARIAKTAPSALMKIKGGTGGHVSSGRKGAAEPLTEPSPVPETLKILNDCIIFVDVRTDDGDEAGSLFIDMLGGVGARVLTRVGQTCTHIVFKNGLMSTLTRYRMLRDPKPLVVGIAWVVECVEQRKRVEETKFLVDVEDMYYSTGASKRRRSMLPRPVSSEMPLSSDTEREDGDADQSMDGSSSSMIIEVLPPLELARRRKSMLLGPRP